MMRLLFLVGVLVSVTASAAVSPDIAKAKKQNAIQHKMVATSTRAAIQPKQATAKSTLTANQIVNKNVAARGGIKAWRAVGTLNMSGRLEAGGTQNQALPFTLKMKRPLMSRTEIRFLDKTAVQVFDGVQGWKVRPFLGRDDVEPYTTAEAKAATGWQELDGPLVDYAKKGTKIKLVGMQAVEGSKAYQLKLTLKNGETRNVWIDAKSFLERKIDGEPRKLDGKLRNVVVYYRDYKTVKGLTFPHVFETVVEGDKQPHKLYIEQLLVNQPMDNALFAKPQLAEPQVVKVKASK